MVAHFERDSSSQNGANAVVFKCRRSGRNRYAECFIFFFIFSLSLLYMCNVYCCADNKRMSTAAGGLYWRISRMHFDIIPADFSFFFSCFYMGDIPQFNNPISLQSFEQGERRHQRSGDV